MEQVRQSIFISLSNDSVKNVTMFVALSWADAFYESCQGRCLNLGGGVIIGELWGSSESK